ncbi:hypothetical protein [Kiloniella sp.]|uniref:hypothetical protein n=1 Tax=Kiloniella sp. TaxID=1938587 RepID=UPI003B01C34F
MLIFGYSFAGYSQEGLQCPKRIAVLSDSTLAEISKEILLEVYKDLGCTTAINKFPGRRGIASFNNGSVDGEMYRIKGVEPRYSRNFVRSELPLFTLTGSIWLHPDKGMHESLPTGYVLGLIWNEKYMAGRRGKVFKSLDEVFKAYEEGELGGFLCSDLAVQHRISNNEFAKPPYLGERIMAAPLYHYLGSEFTPFMELFSSYLRSHTPFAHLGPSQTIEMTN